MRIASEPRGRTGARALLVGLALTLLSCRRDDQPVPPTSRAPAADSVRLTGGGASLPYPLYAQWMNAYATERGVRLNYLSLGSTEGIERLDAGRLDFAASEVPMAALPLGDGERQRSAGVIWQVPTAVAGVALTYHLPGVTRPLRLTPDLIAELLLGTITRWNDPRLRTVNPQLTLPDLPITVVHRGDGSGTTYILSDYLSQTSAQWQQRVGRGVRLTWPVGKEARGNEGIAASVRETAGSLGYVEVGYARLHRLPVAHLRNRQGRFISPMPFEIASAAADALEEALQSERARGDMLAALRRSIVNADGPRSYPLASFTWMLIPVDALGAERTRDLLAFLRWALLEREEVASRLGYVPLPASVAEPMLDQLTAIVPR